MRRGSRGASGQHIRLTRTAQLAGEAFAFVDHEADHPSSRRFPLGGIGGLFLALAVVTGFYVGL